MLKLDPNKRISCEVKFLWKEILNHPYILNAPNACPFIDQIK
jgi:hypothetical protein